MDLFDCHTHSCFSLDAHFPIDQMVDAARMQGLTGIALTDHADMDYFEETRVWQRMQAAACAMEKARAAWSGKIEVLKGVEIGQALCNMKAAQRIWERGDYDFIIAAVHSIPAAKDFIANIGPGIEPGTVADYLKAYFREVAETIRQTDFDTLAHLTYPLRYIRPRVHFVVDLLCFERQILDVMKALVDKGGSYELNLKPFAPDDLTWLQEEGWLLALYKQVGGHRVTIGTDAHVPEKVGYGLHAGLALLEQAGFCHYTIYRGRQPVSVPMNAR